MRLGREKGETQEPKGAGDGTGVPVAQGRSHPPCPAARSRFPVGQVFSDRTRKRENPMQPVAQIGETRFPDRFPASFSAKSEAISDWFLKKIPKV
jgi:hypothetical protein